MRSLDCRATPCAPSSSTARDGNKIRTKGVILIEQSWLRRLLVAVAGVCLSCQVLSASEEASLPPQGVVEITAGQLAQMIVLRNAEALSAELQTDVSESLYESEAALYDPVVFTLARYDDLHLPRAVDDPLNSPFFGAQPEIEEEIGTVEMGTRMRLYSGGEAQLSYQWRERRALALQGNRENVNTMTLSLRQPLLRGLGRKATEADLQVVELERDIDVQRYRERLLEVAGDGVSAYWQLYRALASRSVREESLATVREVREDVSRRVAGGFAPSTDQLEARIAVASRKADLTRSTSLVAEAQGQLLRLLNVEAAREAPSFEPTRRPLGRREDAFDAQARFERALDSWPDLLISQLRVRQEQVRLAFARNERLPTLDLSVGANWNTYSLDDRTPDWDTLRPADGTNGWFAGLEFEMPVTNRQAQRRVDAQRLRLQQAELEVNAVRNALSHDIRTREQQLDAALEEMAQLQEDVELREQLLAAERSAYGLGRSRLTDVLDREDQLNESRQRLIDALTRVELARLALRIADGSLLEVYDVQIEVSQEGAG